MFEPEKGEAMQKDIAKAHQLIDGLPGAEELLPGDANYFHALCKDACRILRDLLQHVSSRTILGIVDNAPPAPPLNAKTGHGRKGKGGGHEKA